MKNLSRQVAKFGGGLKITLTGTVEQVDAGVNQLFNYGIISNVPEDYREGRDESVTCSSYRPRFLRGLKCLAECQMKEIAIPQPDSFLGLVYRSDRKLWRKIAMIRAARLARQMFDFSGRGWRNGAGVEGAGVQVAL